MTDQNIINAVSLIVSVAAAIIALVALLYTVKTYLLKSGIDINGSWNWTQSRSCSDVYISSLTLENNKDRAVVVFKIYLKIGNSYFLELQDNSAEPLIIRPFEVYQANYGPLIHYALNMKRIRLNQMLQDRSVRKRIVLATSKGKYEIKGHVRKWDAIGLFFRNYMTAIILPYRLEYKGKSYGENVRFLVFLDLPNNKEQVIPLLSDDFQTKTFHDLEFTQRTLESEQSLKSHLQYLKKKKKLIFNSFEIIDVQKQLEADYSEVRHSEVQAKNFGFFGHFVLGRYYTWRQNRQIKRLNTGRQCSAYFA